MRRNDWEANLNHTGIGGCGEYVDSSEEFNHVNPIILRSFSVVCRVSSPRNFFTLFPPAIRPHHQPS